MTFFGSIPKPISVGKTITRLHEAKAKASRSLAMAILNDRAGRKEEAERLFQEALYWESQIGDTTHVYS